MQVRGAGVAGRADGADGLGFLHHLARPDKQTAGMAVAGRNTLAVIDHDEVAVTRTPAGIGNAARAGCQNGAAVGGEDVHPVMAFVSAGIGIKAHPKIAGNVSAGQLRVVRDHHRFMRNDFPQQVLGGGPGIGGASIGEVAKRAAFAGLAALALVDFGFGQRCGCGHAQRARQAGGQKGITGRSDEILHPHVSPIGSSNWWDVHYDAFGWHFADLK